MFLKFLIFFIRSKKRKHKKQGRQDEKQNEMDEDTTLHGNKLRFLKSIQA